MNAAPNLEVVSSTGSTSSDLLARPWGEPMSAASLFALEQTAGRGRRGRSWLADGDSSLCLSLSQDILDPDGQQSARLPGLSLAIGAATVLSLEAHFPQLFPVGRLGLKWPNDVVLNAVDRGAPRKCGGILIEVRHQGPLLRIVVGIGLNLRQPEAVSLEPSALPPGALFDEASQPQRTELAQQLAIALHPVIRTCAEQGWQSWRAAFEARNVLQGKSVHLVQTEAKGHGDAGRVVGVAQDGALQIQAEGQAIFSVHAGEVSVRANDWGSASYV